MSILHEHLIQIDNWVAEFRATPLVIDILERRKIFFGEIGSQPPPDASIIFPLDTELEPYVGFPGVMEFHSMGAFSFSASALRRGARVGRYCSIAHNCDVLFDRHPIEWATTSSITYNGFPWNNSPMPYPRPGMKVFSAAHHDFNHGQFDDTLPERHWENAPHIEHDVWIGQQVLLGRNITIGTGAVVAAGSIVTKDVPPYMIVGGAPARVIRQRFPDALMERFLTSQWWSYDVSILKACDYKNPEKFLDMFEELKAQKSLTPFKPPLINYRIILNDLMNRLA